MFQGIEERMIKELTAMAPSTMKIKVVALELLVLTCRLFPRLWVKAQSKRKKEKREREGGRGPRTDRDSRRLSFKH